VSTELGEMVMEGPAVPIAAAAESEAAQIGPRFS
jgi:hypothetical protein